ncbi:MAG: type II toxin-antitoxin system RelE/ParE family toxin [Alphaproteobacteria bacterium]|nr:type II toxin-antitoxin system RelE/ParE family toxin [Alphaproteobacteria bacterium]
MAKYQLSSQAAAALEDIYVYTALTFGADQAEAYHESFHRIFSLLADFPKLGKSADELIPGWRQFRHMKHLIFYTPDSDPMTIQAVIHGSMDVRKHLMDE